MRRGKKSSEQIELEKREKESPTFCLLTYRFRVKGRSACRILERLSRVTNLIWNFCNATAYSALRNHSKWLTQYDLNRLTTGTTKELDCAYHSQSVNAICEEYVTRRNKARKRKLKWRVSQGSRKSLGWVPFKSSAVVFDGKTVQYAGRKFRIWNSWDGHNPKQRKFEGEIRSGSFSQDAQGYWYVNLTCKVSLLKAEHRVEEVGIDLGLKTSATLSDGTQIENPGTFREWEERLGKAQRAHKKRQIRKIHAKIRNKRKDSFHKQTTKIAKKYKKIFVGNVSGEFLQSSHGKSSTDASIGIIRDLLKYKAIRHSGRCFDANESSSTITCSSCLRKTGPSGLSGLGVREWKCSECHACHDRDINAALNILRVGRDSLRVAQAA